MSKRAILTFILATAGGSSAGCVPQADGPCNYPHCKSWKIDSSEYVRNPSVKTKREYWAVAKDGSRAYLFPRPDGFRTIAEECKANGPNADLFLRNALCEPVASEAALARVNGMSVDDALAVSTFLHEHLVFQRATTASAGGIEPFPYRDDELGICDENPTERNGVLKSLCDRAEQSRKGGDVAELAHVYTEAEVTTMPPLLNKYYGVESSR